MDTLERKIREYNSGSKSAGTWLHKKIILEKAEAKFWLHDVWTSNTKLYADMLINKD